MDPQWWAEVGQWEQYFEEIENEQE